MHSLPCSRWGLCVMVFPAPTMQGQVLEGNVWLHHASARAVENTSRQLGSHVLEVFPWWSPSGQLSFAPPWQNVPPSPNVSLGTAGKKWHIKAWAPCVWVICRPLDSSLDIQVRAKPLYPLYWEQTLLPSPRPRGFTVYCLFHWQSQLMWLTGGSDKTLSSSGLFLWTPGTWWTYPVAAKVQENLINLLQPYCMLFSAYYHIRHL